MRVWSVHILDEVRTHTLLSLFWAFQTRISPTIGRETGLLELPENETSSSFLESVSLRRKGSGVYLIARSAVNSTVKMFWACQPHL